MLHLLGRGRVMQQLSYESSILNQRQNHSQEVSPITIDIYHRRNCVRLQPLPAKNRSLNILFSTLFFCSRNPTFILQQRERLGFQYVYTVERKLQVFLKSNPLCNTIWHASVENGISTSVTRSRDNNFVNFIHCCGKKLVFTVFPTAYHVKLSSYHKNKL